MSRVRSFVVSSIVAGSLAALCTATWGSASILRWGAPPAEWGRDSHRDPLNGPALARASELLRAREVDRQQPEALAAGTGCIELPAEPWFTVVRPLPSCYLDAGVWLNFQSGDIDGDGQWEWLAIRGDTSIGESREVVSMDSQVSGDVTTITSRLICPVQALLEAYVAEHIPGHQYSSVNSWEWRDIDHDQDLDPVVLVGLRDDAGQWVPGVMVWIENTGHEHAQGLVGDIDGDGAVQAADLAMLLANWTG